MILWLAVDPVGSDIWERLDFIPFLIVNDQIPAKSGENVIIIEFGIPVMKIRNIRYNMRFFVSSLKMQENNTEKE